MNITEFMKPELVIVTIACYFTGIALKKTSVIKDELIPLILGVFSIVICLVYVGATSSFTGTQSMLMGLFTAITQGVLLAGASTYVNQLVKQTLKAKNKTEE